MTFKEFIKFIKAYESHNFCGDGLNDAEAEEIAELVLGNYANEKLDGVTLSNAYHVLREEKDDYEEPN